MERKCIYDILDEYNYRDKDGHKLYKVKCKYCGYEAISRKSTIYRTNICTHNKLFKFENGKYVKIHNFTNKRIHNIFNSIKDRCYNPKSKSYKFYGNKGIKICNEWLEHPSKFEEWALNNGYSDKLTIDRINPNLDYCPANCRWITALENSKYKSTTNVVTINGITKTGREWATFIGKGVNYINKYIRKYGISDTKQKIEEELNKLTIPLV